ncbi:MAG TPA: flagellar hook-length control protein FliK [Micavibrio sp.]|nr:flagellar hook-length control protein FliK [Micavibrio sp.]
MSDISPLLTKIASGSTAAAQNAQALGGSGAGVFAAGLGGGNFWDMIIAQFAASLEGDKPKSGTGLTNPLLASAAPETKAPVKAENPLALLQIALSSQMLDADGNVVVSAPETDPAKLQSQLEMTNTIINQLKALIPGNAEKEGMFAAILGKLQSKSDTLQASLSALENPVITKDTPVEEIPMPLLIALGLTPSEISEMTERLQSLEKKLGRDITVEDLIAGVGGLIPPAPETPAIAVAALKTTPAGAGVISTIDENTEPTDDLAAKLNAMDVGGAEQISDEDALENQTKKLFDSGAGDKADPSVTDGKVKKSTTHFRENLVNMLNTHKSQQGQMLFPAGAFAADTDAQIYQQFGFAPTSGLSFGTTAQAASLVSSPALAGQAHPASQMVAATMIKAGKNGSDNIMTLRLDPPELGNVSIRLQFGKDKMVKAVITAEKPETYMMLQRDSHALERALQSAGLETGSDSLSFQLSDNGTFAHDNNGKGANDSFGGGKAGPQNADATDIIQSSVTWQVDPSTGHVRYNIFA